MCILLIMFHFSMMICLEIAAFSGVVVVTRQQCVEITMEIFKPTFQHFATCLLYMRELGRDGVNRK